MQSMDTFLPVRCGSQDHIAVSRYNTRVQRSTYPPASPTPTTTNTLNHHNRDLGLHDMQYLEQEHYARACYVAPLVVADNSQGALSIAATQPDAFNG